MVDNVEITAGTGTTVHADEYTHGTYGAGKSQVVKVTWGPAGSGNDVDVATGKPLPVQVRSATGLIPIGEPTDAKVTDPDAASATTISLLKGLIQVIQDTENFAAGTAGTASANVMTVQGIAASTPLPTQMDTGTLVNGVTALTPKFAAISASTSGDANTLVAAVTSKKIRVLAYNFIAAGTVNAKFSSDPAGTPAYLTGLKYCVANTGLVAGFNPLGWFETASGKALGINLSAAIAIGGELLYVEV